ncbi:MAG: hypothetical protein MK105_09880 [Crocinitomicaceae bacterium]|nr:hypothetical protein [Crocinitomicaceae bacterium]
MDEFELDDTQNRGPRPGFLTVLCVLSFIATGLGVLTNVFNFVSGPQSEEQMLEAKVALTQSISTLKDAGMTSFVDLMDKIQAMSEQVNENFYLAAVISLITVAIGLFGVIKMWQGFKVGFHLYIGYCLLSIAGLYIYVSAENIPTMVVVWNLILSALFVFLYSRNLKWMR